MDRKYESCPYCEQEISQEPIIDKHQLRFSVRCPHCLSHRGEWKESIEKAVESWNSYMRESSENLLY